MREQGFFWQFKARRSIEYQAHGGILLWPPYGRWNALISKKSRRPWFSQKPPVQNGRADMSAVRRLFSFAVVRQLANRLFFFMRIIIKSKCHRNVRAELIFDKKTGWIVTKLGHFKNFLRNGEKSGAAHAAPPIPYGYSIVLICSTRDCFFRFPVV